MTGGSAGRSGRGVAITLDRARVLRFDYNAVCSIETALGQALSQITAKRTLGFREIRAFFWAGLAHEDDQLTLGQAGDLLQGFLEAGGSIDDLATVMHRALIQSGLIKTPEPGQQEAAGPGAPLVSGSSSSSPSTPPLASSALPLASS